MKYRKLSDYEKAQWHLPVWNMVCYLAFVGLLPLRKLDDMDEMKVLIFQVFEDTEKRIKSYKKEAYSVADQYNIKRDDAYFYFKTFDIVSNAVHAVVADCDLDPILDIDYHYTIPIPYVALTMVAVRRMLYQQADWLMCDDSEPLQ